MKLSKKSYLYLVASIIVAIITTVMLLVFLLPTRKRQLLGDGSVDNPYIISNVDELYLFRDNVNNGTNYAGQYIIMTSDLDLKNINYTPIGSTTEKAFMGNFDGQGHTIKNLYIKNLNATQDQHFGLFAFSREAIIKNVNITNSYLYACSPAGKVGTVKAATNGTAGGNAVPLAVGSITGRAENCIIENCNVVATVNAVGGNGGNGGNGGAVTSGAGKSGGAGGNGGGGYAGGVVGVALGSTISKCSFVGDVYAYAGGGGTGGTGSNAYSGVGGVAGKGGNAGLAYCGGIVSLAYTTTAYPNKTTIDECYVNASVRLKSGNGGSGGAGGNSTGTNRGASGGAGGYKSNFQLGGIAGAIYGDVTNCFAEGTLEAWTGINGTPGNGGYGTSSGGAFNYGASPAAPDNTSRKSLIGGITGRLDGVNPKISNVYTKFDIQEMHAQVFQKNFNTKIGGIVGEVLSSGASFTNAVSLSQNYVAEKHNELNTISHIASFSSADNLASANDLSSGLWYLTSATIENNSSNSNGHSFDLMTSIANEINVDSALNFSEVFSEFSQNIWEIDQSVNGGLPTLKNVAFQDIPKHVFNVSTRNEFLALSKRIGSKEMFLDVTINILSDITLNDWQPIGPDYYSTPRKLVINGNNHVLRGMKVSKTTSYKGLIGYVVKLEVYNLTIEDPIIDGADGNCAGGLAGYVQWYAIVKNCHVTQSNSPTGQKSIITAKQYAAGLIGTVQGFGYKSLIEDCSSTVNVKSVKGASPANTSYAAGLLAALNFVTVRRCYATGDVNVEAQNQQTFFAGSFIGYITQTSHISDCFATGNVTMGSEASFIGAIAHHARYSTVENCYNAGNVAYTHKKGTSGTYYRYGGIISRAMALNLTLQNNVAITPKMTVSYTSNYMHMDRLFSTTLTYRTYVNVATTVHLSAKTRETYIANNNFFNSDQTIPAAKGATGNAATQYTNYGSTTAMRTGVPLSTIKTREFWESQAKYDFEDTWDWDENVNDGYPTLKSNPYIVPGEGDNAIEINDLSDLKAFRDSVNGGNTYARKIVLLKADIDLSNTTWTPIGKSAAISFQGTFDGNSHAIKDMTVSLNDVNRGFFGYTVNAQIKNLTLENPVINSVAKNNAGALLGYGQATKVLNCHTKGGSVRSTGTYIGGLVGYLNGNGCAIENCSVGMSSSIGHESLMVYGNGGVGGLVGAVNATTAHTGALIKNSFTSCHVFSTANSNGGIAGLIYGATIESCYSTGSVTGKPGYYCGGIAGYLGITQAASTINNCFATGDISSDATESGASTGGIAGRIGVTGCKISNCLFTGIVTSGTTFSKTASSDPTSAAGGIAGYVTATGVTVGNCAVASERIIASNYKGSYAYAGAMGTGNGASKPTALSGSKNFYNKDIMTSRTKGTASYTTNVEAAAIDITAFKDRETYENVSTGLGWDFDNVWSMTPGVNNGYPYLTALGAPQFALGTKTNPHYITSADDFKQFRANVNSGRYYAGEYIEQTADIDMTGIGVTGIDYNTGFMGNYNGNEHKLLNVNLSGSVNYFAVFGYVINAKIQNVIVEEPIVTNTATVSNIGSLIGIGLYNVYVDNCAVIGGNIKATSSSNVGGLIGCLYRGGNIISRSYSTAQVSGGKNVGGLVGYVVDSVMSQCYSKGKVTGSLASGMNSGGLVGLFEIGSLTDSYAISDVKDSSSSTYSFAGGVVGQAVTGNFTATRCYFYGTVSASTSYRTTTAPIGSYAAGIIAYANATNTKIVNCVSVIKSIASSAPNASYQQGAYYAGGGYTNKSTTTNCYHVATTLPSVKGGDTRNNTGTATTMEKLADRSVFDTLQYDFDNVWNHDARVNEGLPTLRNLLPDNSDITSLLNKAKGYKREDWNVPTFNALQLVIEEVEEALRHEMTFEEKTEALTSLADAIAALRADKTKLEELYNRVLTDYEPYKEYYSNYSLTESTMAASKIILDDDSNKYKNPDVNANYTSLMLAIDNLIVDKTELNKEIERANSKNVNDFMAEDWIVLQQALGNAISVNNNSRATALEVKNATETLRNAIDGLQIDKSDLEALIIKVYSYIGVEASLNGTTGKIEINDESQRLTADKFENYVSFENALNAAIEAYEDHDLSVAQLHNAVFNLNVESNALTLSKEKLQNLYNEASFVVEKYYTAESYTLFKVAFDAAGEVLEKENATTTKLLAASKEIDNALSDLQSAFDALVVNKTELGELIALAEMEEDNEDYYDADSWKHLQDTLSAAKVVYDSPSATAEQIQQSIKDLNAAISNLKINLDYLRELIVEANTILSADVSYYTTASIEILTQSKNDAQNLIDISENFTKENIAQIKTTTSSLEKAIEGLEVDKGIIRSYIIRVEGLSPEVYAAESIATLKSLAEEATTLLAGTPTNEQCLKMIKEFESAFDNIKPNKDKLIERVREVSRWSNAKYRQDNQGNWILDEQGNLKVFVIYSTITWDAMQTKLKEASDCIISSTATVEDVETALNALNEAVANLDVDTSELELRIEKAEKIVAEENLYSVDTITVLKEKLQAAKDLIASERKLTIDEVQLALDELVEAINNIQVDKSALLELLAKAEGLKEYEVYFTTTSFDTLVNQIEFVNGLKDNDNLTAEDVASLIDILQSAIDNLKIVTDALQDLVDSANALEEEFIMPDNFAEITRVKNLAVTMLEGGQFTIDEYVKTLNDLNQLLENIQPNREAFENFIIGKEALLTKKYTAASLADLQTDITSARAVLSNNLSTYFDIIDEVEKLRTAERNLVPDKTELENLISEINTEMNNTLDEFDSEKYVYEYYTTDSYDKLSKALIDGDSVINNTSATLEDVENAIANINAAKNALIVDKTLLQSVISECEGYSEEYFEKESFINFKEKLEQSKIDVDNDSLTLTDYITSYNNLVEARAALVFSMSALDELLAIARAKNEEEYTAFSFSELQSVISEAEEFVYDEELGIEPYKQMCDQLTRAINSLVSVKELAEAIKVVETFISENGDSEKYSTTSIAAVINLLNEGKALYEEFNPTQTAVDEMTAKLLNYESLLVDVSALKAKIDEIDAFLLTINEEDYTKGSFKALTDTLALANAALNNGTEEEIASLILALDEKKEALIYLRDAKDLSEAEHIFVSETDSAAYTEESWSAYTQTLTALDNVIANDNATREEIESAIKALQDAKSALEEKPFLGFELIETNTTFKFVDDDGKEVSLADHVYDSEAPLYLRNIAMGDTLGDIIKQFKNYENIKVYSKDDTEIELTTTIATGQKLKIYNGEVLFDEIILVLIGDLNGDGRINIADKGALDAQIKGKKPLEGAFKLSGDISGDGRINILDKASLDSQIKGKTNIFDGLSVKGEKA